MLLTYKDLQQPARTGWMDALRSFYRNNQEAIDTFAVTAVLVVVVASLVLLALEGLMCLRDVLGY